MTTEAKREEVWNPTLRERIGWIWRYWRPHRGFLLLLFLLTGISSAVAIAYPMVFKLVLDRIADSISTDGLRTLTTGAVDRATLVSVLQILGVIAIGRFVAGLYPAFRAWVNLRLDIDIRTEVFGKILEKDYRFFNRFRTGDLATRLMDDITEYPKLAWFSCSGIFRALESGSKMLFCVGAMLLLDWRLSLLAVVPLPLMLFVIYRLRTRLRQAYHDQQVAISQTNDMLEATFSGVRIVKAFSAETNQSSALWRVLQPRIGIQLRVQQLHVLAHILDAVASRIGQLIVISLGGIMIARGELSLGTLYALYIYLDMLVEPMIDLPNLLVTSRQAFVCMDREEEVIRFPAPAARENLAEDVALGKIESIELDSVGFGYDSNSPVLRGVEIGLNSGDRVAVVGEVACGKTTLLRLLAGQIHPTHGVIRVNGRTMADLPEAEFRHRLGYAPQESLLFSETIRENLMLGRERDPIDGDAWIDRLLEIVQMQVEIRAMPDGTETQLGQKGTRVSGGQRQRLSIARSLHGRPDLLLLDDCTASLDAENEDRLWEGLDEIIPDAIIVLVSHRLATIRRADKILVLADGKLADVGTHDGLVKSSAVYRRFVEREEERAQVCS